MKLTLTLILLMSIGFVHAQRVGIGTTNPQEKLHVDSNIRIGIGAWSSPMFNRYFKIGDGDYVTIGEAGLDDRLEFSAREFLFKNSGAYGPNNGKVGININTSPAAYLEVNGNVKITDGTQADGRVLTSSSDGTASWKDIPLTQSGFNVTLTSANQNITSSNDVALIFNNEKFRDGGAYNPSNGLFTAPSNGVYSFNVKVEWTITANTSGLYYVYLDVNGSNEEGVKEYIAGSPGNDSKTIVFSSLLKLNALDVVKVYVRQETGVDQTVSVGNTSFSGFRIY